MVAILVLYDLQENLKEINAGRIVKTPYLFPSGADSFPDVLNVRDVKTIRITGKSNEKPGITLVTPRIKTLRPGDKIVAAGRIGNGAPTSDWAMVIDRRVTRGGYTTLAQCISPPHDELFSITYMLEPEDLRFPIMIRANPWGIFAGYMDFFLDSVLITRTGKAGIVEYETRDVVYSLAADDSFVDLKPGDIHRFIKSSGTPKFTVFKHNGKKAVRIKRRINNWDSLDIWFPAMGLKRGNHYTITVRGKIDGPAPPQSKIMFYVLPDYIWQSVTSVSDDTEFTLEYTFPAGEQLEAVRVATNSEGASMDFTIYEIEVTSDRGDKCEK